MIEELKILAEVIGDLSAIGGWLAGAYIAYKFFVAAIIGVVVWKVFFALIDFFGRPLTFEAASRLKDKIRQLESEKDEAVKKADRYAHMYKIMEEKNNVEQ